MANHPSAEKRNRQRISRTSANRVQIGATRTAVRKAREGLAGGDAAQAQTAVKAASVALARAASKGRIHKKTAARKTSRLQAQLAKRAVG